MLLSVGCSAAVSVVGANIDEEGHLVLSMSDGSTIDAGYAKGEKGDKGDIGPQGPQGIQGPQPNTRLSRRQSQTASRRNAAGSHKSYSGVCATDCRNNLHNDME